MLVVTRIRAASVIIAVFACPSLATQQPATQQTPPGQGSLAKLQEAKFETLPPPVETFFSAGYHDRATEVQSLLRRCQKYFSDTLSVSPTIRLALLTEPDWKRIADPKIPYGLAYVNPRGLVVMSAPPSGAIVDEYQKYEGFAPESVRASVKASGAAWSTHAKRMADLVGFHELGHVYSADYGIRSHRRWFNEFLATYLGYAFMSSASPEYVNTWQLMAGAGADGPKPKYTTLAAFEELYSGMRASNYIWYEDRFTERVRVVYAKDGIEFVRRVREMLPRDDSPELSNEALLTKLDSISPGFTAWARSFGGI